MQATCSASNLVNVVNATVEEDSEENISTSSNQPTPALTSLGSQGNPLDIACGMQEDPVRPVNCQFPSSSIGNRERSFNPRWYNKYQWLEYSVSRDAIFCYPCRYFAHGCSKAEDTFISIGYRDWKHATGRGGALTKHDTCMTHQEAVSNWCEYKVNLQSGTSVASSLDNARKEQISKNRHYLKALLQALMYCTTQEIALRGHRESSSSQSVNKGNFIELLELLSKFDPIIHDRLKDGPKNAQYTSHGIQNELLHILANRVRKGICEDVKSAQAFSILADETKDFA